MKLLLTICAYLVSLAVVAVAAFFMAIVLAGPHGGLLPAVFEKPVLVVGWLAVLVVPAWIARMTWRRLGRHPRT